MTRKQKMALLMKLEENTNDNLQEICALYEELGIESDEDYIEMAEDFGLCPLPF